MSRDIVPQLTDEIGWAVVHTVRSPLLVLDGSLHIRLANEAFCRTYDLRREDVEGELLFEIADGQWDLPPLHETMERVLPEDREIRDAEVRAELKHLGRRVLLVNARRVESRKSGGHELILLSLEDVTRREALEREVQAYMDLLEKSNRDLEQFAHAASHDLQEPLRKISTYVNRLESILDPEALGERGVQYLERMNAAVARLRRRIDDILRLSRVSRARPQLESVDLGTIVDAVLEELGAQIEAVDGEVDVEALPTVIGDASLLHSVFQNLVANALKFHAPGEPSRIEIRSPPAPDDGEIRVTVEDRGIGFEKQYAERIFQPFERLHGVAEYEGSGVGLALCRRVMEHHGGEIRAEPREGGGARFTLVFSTSPPGAPS